LLGGLQDGLRPTCRTFSIRTGAFKRHRNDDRLGIASGMGIFKPKEPRVLVEKRHGQFFRPTGSGVEASASTTVRVPQASNLPIRCTAIVPKSIND